VYYRCEGGADDCDDDDEYDVMKMITLEQAACRSIRACATPAEGDNVLLRSRLRSGVLDER